MPYPCAIPGINLGDYSTRLPRVGWPGACAGSYARVQINDAGAAVTVDRAIAELVALIMHANEAQGYHYRPADTGAYNCRKISGTNVWSLHAYGLAIDENWSTNPYTSPLRTDKPGCLVELWNRYGFAWGGHYSGSKDAMHFEFMGTPAQAVQALALARSELGGGAPPPPPPPPGDGGDAQVRQDQFDLNDTGFTCTVDGFAGPETTQRIKDFQWSARRPVTGVMSAGDRDAIHGVPSWHSAGPSVADDPGGYPASQWQRKLVEHGWRVETDGVWGAHSRSILQQFQADKGIVADGNRGPSSWTCLYCTTN
jgi:hypothetical protein